MPASSSGPYRRMLLWRASQLSLWMPDTMIRTSTPRFFASISVSMRRFVRHEVRVGDEDRLPRADDRQVVHRAHRRRAGLRRADDRLRRQRAGGLERRVVAAGRRSARRSSAASSARSRSAAAAPPGLRCGSACRASARGSWALPSQWSAMPAPPVKPTRPSTMSDLRWVRWLKRAERVPVDRVVPRDLAAAVFEHPQDLVADARRADGVEQDLHRDAGARRVRRAPRRTGGRSRPAQ